MEGELESEWERAGGQWGGQQGQLMEGESEGGVGLRQVDRGVEVDDHDDWSFLFLWMMRLRAEED